MNIRLVKCLGIITGIVLYTVASAQMPGIMYSGIISAGAPFGENKPNVIIQTVHGVKMQSWFAGVGAGLDAYYKPSIPIFVDIRKNILHKSHTPFVYADGGINIVASKADAPQRNGTYTKRRPGAYLEAGAGYRAGLAKNAVNFTVGYSYKGYVENIYGARFIPNAAPEENALLEKKSFYLRRIAFKIGFEF